MQGSAGRSWSPEAPAGSKWRNRRPSLRSHMGKQNMKLRFSKRATIALTTALVVAGAGTAYAFIKGGTGTTTGTGSVTAAVNLTVTGFTPGAFNLNASKSIDVTVHNPGGQPQRLSTVRVAPGSAWSVALCGPTSNFVAADATYGSDIPAGGDAVVTVTATLLNDPDHDQTDCVPALVATANP